MDAASGPLEPVELAHERAIRIGPVLIEPPLRRVAHDDGREEFLEPRVMQVLVLLARSEGRIFTRDELNATCWRGLVVGEDAINRVLGRLRRLTESLCAGAFTIETITKVGYRLIPAPGDARVAGAQPAPPPAARLAGPPLEKPTIAVLPFKNMSGDPDQDYLAEAITEDIVTELSRWRWFFVIDRRSTLRYRDGEVDLAQMGRELGVRYAVDGSIRQSGARVRVSAQLIDTASRTTLWADRHDRLLVDLLGLQDDIIQQIVAAIEPTMLNDEGARVTRKSLADFSALDCFYRGMWCFNQLSEAHYEEALTFFREAIRRDPDLSLGYIGVSRTLYGRAVYGWSDDPTATLRESRAAAQAAIRLDPRDGGAHCACAGASLYLGEHAAALAEVRRSVALNPNFSNGHFRLGMVLLFSGRAQEAIEPIELTLRLNPLDPQRGPTLETLALAHYQARNYELAVEWAAAAIQAGSIGGSSILAAALARLGRMEEAAQAAAHTRGFKASPRRPLAAPYVNREDFNHLREGMRLASAFASAG
jgi:TolB-like protein/cytochrome c-type biogenesis protein CcmH/NrfG